MRIQPNVLLTAALALLVAAAGAAPATAQVCDPPVTCPTGLKCDRQTCEICGDDSPDSLCGTGGNDVICSLGGADTIVAGSGTDVICPGTGSDIVDGQSGNDTYGCTEACIASLATRVCGTGACNSAAQDGAGCDNFCNTENLTGSPFNDTLIGNTGRNILKGGFGTGADVLNGGSGNDDLFGESGQDTLSGDAGADLLDGGPGTDTVTCTSSCDCDLKLTTNACLPDGDDLISIENLTGSPFDDDLKGNDGNNTLRGGGGNDFLAGGLGTDTCDGGPGEDICIGCETQISCENFGGGGDRECPPNCQQ